MGAHDLCYNDPRSSNTRYQIFDLSELDVLDLTQQEQEIGAAIEKVQSQYVPNLRIAILLKDDRFVPQLEDYVMAMNENSNWQARFFFDRAEALAWVNRVDEGRAHNA